MRFARYLRILADNTYNLIWKCLPGRRVFYIWSERMRKKKIGKKELQTCQIIEQSATKVLLFGNMFTDYFEIRSRDWFLRNIIRLSMSFVARISAQIAKDVRRIVVVQLLTINQRQCWIILYRLVPVLLAFSFIHHVSTYTMLNGMLIFFRTFAF